MAKIYFTLTGTKYYYGKEFLKPGITLQLKKECQTAHYGRRKQHFDFGESASPIVPYRYLPQTLSGMTAGCRSLV